MYYLCQANRDRQTNVRKMIDCKNGKMNREIEARKRDSFINFTQN